MVHGRGLSNTLHTQASLYYTQIKSKVNGRKSKEKRFIFVTPKPGELSLSEQSKRNPAWSQDQL
jgi:hypothetical protein